MIGMDKSPFAKLPGDIRNWIYEYALHYRHSLELARVGHRGEDEGLLHAIFVQATGSLPRIRGNSQRHPRREPLHLLRREHHQDPLQRTERHPGMSARPANTYRRPGGPSRSLSHHHDEELLPSKRTNVRQIRRARDLGRILWYSSH